MVSCLLQFQYQLKGVSFLPRMDLGAYPQMPYEAIPEDDYREVSEGSTKAKQEGIGRQHHTRTPYGGVFLS
jgi:hypothetical protein